MHSSKPNKSPRRGLPLLALLPAAFLLTAGVMVLQARPKNPHDFQSVGCNHCHIVVPGQSVIVKKRVFRRDISELCMECHSDSKENEINHRIGIIPSMRVPEDLHLGNRGEITCITCHMPHLPYTDRRNGGRTYFLRRSILKRELCIACHYEDKFEEPSSSFRIIAPIDNSITKTLPVPFIGTVSDDLISEVTLHVNGVPMRLSIKNRTFSTMLTLQEGINNLKVEAKKARTANMTILYSPSLGDDVSYKLYYSHGILKKSDCNKICHTDESTNAISVPDNVLCGKCHPPMNSQKYLHGPVAAGSCTVCHDPHGQTNRYFLHQSGEKLCFNCHTEKEILLHFIDKAANKDLLRSKGCNFCHDPHQSDKKYLLKKT